MPLPAPRRGRQRGYVIRHGCVPPGSTQQVTRRVVVPVERQATGAGDPTGRKVEVLKLHSALRAAARRVGWVYQGDLTTSTFSLVREILPERSPATIQNALAQMVVANHGAHVQVFQRDAVIAAHQAGAQLVQEVGALRRNMRLLTLHGQQGFATVIAARFRDRLKSPLIPLPLLPHSRGEGEQWPVFPLAPRRRREGEGCRGEGFSNGF